MTKFIAVDEKLQKYCDDHVNGESQILKNLYQNTKLTQQAPQMMSGPMIGQLLNILVKFSGAKKILEVGMFTGYTALSMAEALPVDGELVSLEFDEESINFAKKYFSQSPHGNKIKVLQGKALDILPPFVKGVDSGTESGGFDLAFIDAQKAEYPEYFELVLPLIRQNGIIILDNSLLEGTVLNPQKNKQKIIFELNKRLSTDKRIKQVILPIQDGFSILMKL